jgi:hypothetical protein
VHRAFVVVAVALLVVEAGALQLCCVWWGRKKRTDFDVLRNSSSNLIVHGKS